MGAPSAHDSRHLHLYLSHVLFTDEPWCRASGHCSNTHIWCLQLRVNGTKMYHPIISERRGVLSFGGCIIPQKGDSGLATLLDRTSGRVLLLLGHRRVPTWEYSHYVAGEIKQKSNILASPLLPTKVLLPWFPPSVIFTSLPMTLA